MSQKAYYSRCSDKLNEIEWAFEFNYKNQIGTITNEYSLYPVYEGRALFTILPQKVEEWLAKQWNYATKALTGLDIYLGRKTEMRTNKRNTWLTNVFCPVCLETKSIFENHHCVARFEGGRDGYANVLRICATCHAIISWGCFEERWGRENAALFHQVMYFGFDVYPRVFQKPILERAPESYNRITQLEEYIGMYDRQGGEQKQQIQMMLMSEARFLYQFYRDISLGRRDWKDALKVFPDRYLEFQKEYDWVQF